MDVAHGRAVLVQLQRCIQPLVATRLTYALEHGAHHSVRRGQRRVFGRRGLERLKRLGPTTQVHIHQADVVQRHRSVLCIGAARDLVQRFDGGLSLGKLAVPIAYGNARLLAILARRALLLFERPNRVGDCLGGGRSGLPGLVVGLGNRWLGALLEARHRRVRPVKRRLRPDFTRELVVEIQLGQVLLRVLRELVEPPPVAGLLEADLVGLHRFGANLVGLLLELLLEHVLSLFRHSARNRRVLNRVSQVLVGLTNPVEGRDLPVWPLEGCHLFHALGGFLDELDLLAQQLAEFLLGQLQLDADHVRQHHLTLVEFGRRHRIDTDGLHLDRLVGRFRLVRDLLEDLDRGSELLQRFLLLLGLPVGPTHARVRGDDMGALGRLRVGLQVPLEVLDHGLPVLLLEVQVADLEEHQRRALRRGEVLVIIHIIVNRFVVLPHRTAEGRRPNQRLLQQLSVVLGMLGRIQLVVVSCFGVDRDGLVNLSNIIECLRRFGRVLQFVVQLLGRHERALDALGLHIHNGRVGQRRIRQLGRREVAEIGHEAIGSQRKLLVELHLAALVEVPSRLNVADDLPQLTLRDRRILREHVGPFVQVANVSAHVEYAEHQPRGVRHGRVITVVVVQRAEVLHRLIEVVVIIIDFAGGKLRFGDIVAALGRQLDVPLTRVHQLGLHSRDLLGLELVADVL